MEIAGSKASGCRANNCYPHWCYNKFAFWQFMGTTALFIPLLQINIHLTICKERRYRLPENNLRLIESLHHFHHIQMIPRPWKSPRRQSISSVDWIDPKSVDRCWQVRIFHRFTKKSFTLGKYRKKSFRSVTFLLSQASKSFREARVKFRFVCWYLHHSCSRRAKLSPGRNASLSWRYWRLETYSGNAN